MKTMISILLLRKEAETMDEYWDLFDLNDNFVKTMRRGEYHIPPTLYHKTVEIIPTNGAGLMLLTRRAMTKNKAPGLYEFPAGSVKAGESPRDAAFRELREETGLVDAELVELDAVMSNPPGMKRFIYMAMIPNMEKAKIVLQPEETIAYRLITFQQWLGYIEGGIFDSSRIMAYSPSVLDSIEEKVGKAKVNEPRKKRRSLRAHKTFILEPINHEDMPHNEESDV